MAVYKCKMCGGTIEVKEGQNVVTCEFCGTTQTVHSFDNEKKNNYFKRAEALRYKCEFDKAAGVYETIVTEFPKEAEAYWGLLLCKYGIEYVDDPKTGLKIPTCHRTRFESIYDDADFLNVLKYADVIAKSVYEDEAKEISKLQKSILDISSKEDPFDIFICYKETDGFGERTEDSVLAQDIYKELTKEGYRVFFSRITLEDKLGSQYEPYIFAALHSSKIMLHVTTSDEHSESIWVRNEWSRYLSLIQEGQKKTLIPCYKGINAYDLPDEMQHLQGQDMSKIGAMQDLLHGIEKIVRKKTTVIEKKEAIENTAAGGTYKGLLKKGYTYLKNSRFDEANSAFDAAIMISEMPGEAYLGKVLAEYQFKSIEEVLETADEVVADSDNFVMAKEFADDETSKLLKKIEDTLRYNRLKENYDLAMEQLNRENLDSLSLAKDNFIVLDDFENSKEMVNECTYRTGILFMSYVTNINSLDYCDDATKSFEEIIDYKDSKEKINQVAALKEKIISEYKDLCVTKLSISYPKTVNYLSLFEVAKRIKNNRTIVFTPSFKEFASARKEIEDEAIKFIISKCPAYIQSLNQIIDCDNLNSLCSSIETNGNLKSVHELISKRKEELKEIAAAVRKKKIKKHFTITGIICGALAVAVAVFFGVKAIVDENNRKSTYVSANFAMESGLYDDAISYYKSLGNYEDSQNKIKVCEGLKQLVDSVVTRSEKDTIKGIKTIVSAGEKVDVEYTLKGNIYRNSFKEAFSAETYKDTIDNVDFELYQPTEKGYTFINWNSVDVSYKNNRTNLGLLGNWSLNAYLITFDCNHGEFDESTVVPSTYSIESEDIFLPQPKRKGYTFLGWTCGGQYVTKIEHGSIGDISFKANWEANDYKIYFDPNGGTIDCDSINVTFDDDYTLPTPTRDNYGFIGWYDLDNQSWKDGKYLVASDTYLVAQWSADVFTITYDLNGGTNNSDNPNNYTIEDEVVFKEPSKTGYHFDGWFDSKGNQISGIAKGTVGSLTLIAYWTINTYVVNFKNFDGNILETKYVNHGDDVTYTGSTPLKPATAQYTYTFIGWDKSLTSITSDTDIFATFSNTVNKYTITWKNHDGSVLKTDSVYFGSTPLYSGITPTKDADQNFVYTFSGWSPSIALVTGDATYVAQFSSQEIYTYSVASNGDLTITGVTRNTLERYDIPSMINGHEVKKIGSGAMPCHLATEIIVPDSVDYIGKGAFSGCCQLQSITIPFVGGAVNNGVTGLDGRNELNYFGYIFGTSSYENSTRITNYSYSYTTTAGQQTDYYRFYIPNNLKNVNVLNTNELEKNYVGFRSFADNTIIENVSLIGITKTWTQSFRGCANLKSVKLGSTFKEIVGESFAECLNLETIDFGSTQQILSGAFYNCSSLTSVAVPSTTTKIDYNVFRGCTKLESLNLPFVGDGVSTVNASSSFGYIFGHDGSKQTGEIEVLQHYWYYNGGSYFDSTQKFYIPKSLTKIVINGNISTIEYGAFSGLTFVEEIVLPDSVSSVKQYAFYNCCALKTICIPNVTRVNYYSFCDTTSLRFVDLSSCQIFDAYSFMNSGVKEIVLAKNLNTVSEYAFNNVKNCRFYYLGSTDDFVSISISPYNGEFNYETIISFSETKPVDTGIYWHYVNGIPTIWADETILYGDGTISNPFSIESAESFGRSLEIGCYSENEIYVVGTVKTVDYSYSTGLSVTFEKSLKTTLFEASRLAFESDELWDLYYSSIFSDLIGKRIIVRGFIYYDALGVVKITEKTTVGMTYLPVVVDVLNN